MPSSSNTLAHDQPELRALGLKYITDASPGITRKSVGRKFRYFTNSGKVLNHKGELERIARLVIPPAWKDVWICPSGRGYLQATGRDARGRKQYRYHEDFRAYQEETKYHRMTAFASQLPALRQKIDQHLRQPGLSRSKVLGTMVRLLERTLIRVGNEEYAAQNKSFGLSTLRDKHVKAVSGGVRFSFVGKSGVAHDVELADKKLAKIVLRCQDLPGQHLFQYEDERGHAHAVNSFDVNSYIRQISHKDFSAKDFRTWRGTVLAATALESLEMPESQSATRRAVSAVVKDVALELRNRPATCRKYYIHPAILSAFEQGEFHGVMRRARAAAKRRKVKGLTQEEQAVLLALQVLLKES